MKKMLMTGVMALGVAAAFAAPTVRNVAMTQGADRRVTVTYDLEQEDAIVTLSVETNGVALAEGEVADLTGDVNKVVAVGSGKTIVWNACKSWPNHKVENARARVTAWSKSNPPQYLVIELLKGSAAETAGNQMPSFYYTSDAAVPGGVTNRRYKTTHMLFRRVDPTDELGYVEGSAPDETGISSGASETRHTVYLTKKFYMAVYEFTNGQRYYLTNKAVPAGQTEAMPATSESEHWPENYRPLDETWPWAPENLEDVKTTRPFGYRLRKRTGQAFDLPTEAQWEYACRAGTTGALNDGTANLESATTDSNLDKLGLYAGNAGSATGPTEVGSYKPNAWGFYDMHGNLREWTCSKYRPFTSAAQTDPVLGQGDGSSWNYVLRGGCWLDSAGICRSGDRSRNAAATKYCPSDYQQRTGYRLVIVIDQ